MRFKNLMTSCYWSELHCGILPLNIILHYMVNYLAKTAN